MKIEIDLRKSLHENASLLHEKSKLAKRKLAGAEKAIAETKKRIAELEGSAERIGAKEKEVPVKKRTKKWYEKFHWFYSSEGCLVIAGKDAKSNEVLVKRHMEPKDVYLHADLQGAPHTVIKSETCKPAEKTLREAAEFAAAHSRAWKEKFATSDVYSVKPEQVSKSAPSGEALGTGAFMIYGKRTWFRKVPLRLAIGLKREDSAWAVISGPPGAVKKHAEAFAEINQGTESKGSAAKKLKAAFEQKLKQKLALDMDELISAIPAGGCRIL